MLDFDNLNVHLLAKVGAYIGACILAHWPANWLIRKIILRWKPSPEETTDRMGAFIGTLERILTILLVGIEAFTAIGFVITMKSIARYDKLHAEKEFAEYFLAGTLLSLLIALILGLIALRSFGTL